MARGKKGKPYKNRKKITRGKNIFIFILFILMVFILSYVLHPKVRVFVDEKILCKYLNDENATEIFINAQNNPNIITYGNNIAVLEKGEMTLYNKSGQQTNVKEKLNIPMATSILKTNDKYLALAEKGGRKVYFISDDKIIWNRELEFNINNVTLNSNGYVAVIGSNNVYKSIIAVINDKGEELFIIYISSNIVIDAEISNDNNILAIAEINYSKPIVESIIKYISVDKAINDPENSTINIYKQNKLIIDIIFKNKDTLLAHYTKDIYKYTKSKEEKIYEIPEKAQFVDIRSGRNIVILEQVSEGVFSGEYQLTIVSENGRIKTIYKIGKFVPKTLKISNNYIAVNLGQEAIFLTTDGWEKKKYDSNKEIREIILSDKIGLVLYKNSFNVIDI